MLCALIMAGGKGERFWPLSTDEKPKQFLKLLGNDTMIQMTVKRLLPIIPMERIFIVTGKRYINLVKEQIPDLPQRNIIVEPVGRNTAPCIALSAFIIRNYFRDAEILVLPSDHLISDEVNFRKRIKDAVKFIGKNEETVVTFGMYPDRPEIGYGYIKIKDKVDKIGSDICKVEAFVEKPDSDKAQRYIKEGNYLWNGGMFLWKCSTIIKLTQKYLSNTYNVLSEIALDQDDYEKELEEPYLLVDNISIDYGIMEKYDNIYVIPCNFGWDDIGTWNAVERYREKDDDNNVCIGDIKNLKGKNNLIFSSSKPIVLVGLEDMFVVESEDMVLIGKKDEIDKIKEIKHKVC